MTQEQLNKILQQHKLWLDTEGEEGKKADLRSAYLRYCNLRFTDLRHSVLSGANLKSADLSGANLEGVDLMGANLEDTNLTGTGVYFFKGHRYDGIYNSKDDKLYIGCQVHNLEHWLQNYVDIGKEHEYSDEELEAYGQWIKSLKELLYESRRTK